MSDLTSGDISNSDVDSFTSGLTAALTGATADYNALATNATDATLIKEGQPSLTAAQIAQINNPAVAAPGGVIGGAPSSIGSLFSNPLIWVALVGLFFLMKE